MTPATANTASVKPPRQRRCAPRCGGPSGRNRSGNAATVSNIAVTTDKKRLAVETGPTEGSCNGSTISESCRALARLSACRVRRTTTR